MENCYFCAAAGFGQQTVAVPLSHHSLSLTTEVFMAHTKNRRSLKDARSPMAATLSSHLLLICGVPEMSQMACDALVGTVENAFRAVAPPHRPVESVVRLTGRSVTRAAVETALRAISAHLSTRGTRVIVYYNGHGDRTCDHDGDEADGMDEFWRLSGGAFIDDDICRVISETVCAEDSIITLISDSCSSGTMIDTSKIDCRVNWVSIASCTDNQSAFCTSDGGVFTLFGLAPALHALSTRSGIASARNISDEIARRVSIPTQQFEVRYATGLNRVLEYTPIL